MKFYLDQNMLGSVSLEKLKPYYFAFVYAFLFIFSLPLDIKTGCG